MDTIQQFLSLIDPIELADNSLSDEERAIKVQALLEGVLDALRMVKALVYNKDVNIEFLLYIVASYQIAKQNDALDEEAVEPSVVFLESLFPQLHQEETIDVEVIEDEPKE